MINQDSLPWLVNFLNRLVTFFLKEMMFLVSVKSSSQICKIIAFLLPLKALLIAGSETLPSYMSWTGNDGEPALVVVAMALFAGGAYSLHLQFEKFVLLRLGALTRYFPPVTAGVASARVLSDKRTQIVVQVCELFSSILLIVLSACLLLFINWTVGTGFLLLFVLSLVSIYIFWNKGGHIAHVLATDTLHLATVLSSMLFFAGFALLISILLGGYSVEIMVAVIALVVMRLFTSQIVVLVARARSLIKQRRFIEESIFGQTPLVEQGAIGHTKLLTLSQSLLSSLGSVRWLISPQQGVDVVATKRRVDGGRVENFVLKHYSPKLQENCKWESSFFEVEKSTPLGPMIIEESQEFDWRLFDTKGLLELQQGKYKVAVNVFYEMLMSSEPAGANINAYKQKNGSFIERFRGYSFEQVRLPSLPQECIDRVEESWDSILLYLSELPSQYVVKLSKDVLVSNSDSSIVSCLYWDEWKVGPVGSVFDCSNLPVDWSRVLALAKSNRSDIAQVSTDAMSLSRAVSRLDFAMTRQRWGQAYYEVKAIDDCWLALNQ